MYKRQEGNKKTLRARTLFKEKLASIRSGYFGNETGLPKLKGIMACMVDAFFVTERKLLKLILIRKYLLSYVYKRVSYRRIL